MYISPFRKTAFFESQVAGKFFPLCDPTGTPKIFFWALAALEVGSQEPRFLGWTLIKKKKNWPFQFFKRYSCDQCDYKATHKGSLKRHIESVHGDKQYPCDKCDYKTAWKGNLKTHIDSVHDRMEMWDTLVISVITRQHRKEMSKDI